MKRGWIALAVLLVAACTGETGSASASPTAYDFGAPPQGVPLIYVGDPHHSGWYIGADWNGKPRATIKLTAPLQPMQKLVQAPDGSAFMIPVVKDTPSAGFLDRLGAPIPDPNPLSQRMMWANDSTHVCTLDYNPDRHWYIGLKTPGTPTAVHPVALDPSIVQSGIIAIDFASCSAENDRAVLVYNYFGRSTDVYSVRISDGAVLLHQSHPAGVLAGISASEDGSLIAEDSSKSIGYLMGTPAATTTVRRVADSSIVVKLDPSFFLVAFSHDDSLALVSISPLAAGAPTNLALVRLADGAVLWHLGSSEEFAAAWVRPDGPDLAFQLGPPAGPGPGPVEVVVVHPDGTATSLRLR